MKNPTSETYDFLTQVCKEINEKCFANQLPEVLLTIKGKGNVFGYYKQKAFVSHDGEVIVDEIAVNPQYFATHGFSELLQTIAHEMTHQWQHLHGKTSRRAYHNTEFASKMASFGLIASSTGKEGGKKTGQKMADYMAEEGILRDLYNDLNEQGIFIPWYERLGASVAITPTINIVEQPLKPTIKEEIENTTTELCNEEETADEITENTTEVSTKPIITPSAPANVLLSESEIVQSKPTNKPTRVKYTHLCEDAKKAVTIYGKPKLSILCGVCKEEWIEH